MTNQTYRIKALEWVQDGDMHDAVVIVGAYCVFGAFHGGKYKARLRTHSLSEWIGGIHDGLDAAKAACTEHWESLLKQALEEV